MLQKLKPVICECINLILGMLSSYFEWAAWDGLICRPPEEDEMDIIKTFKQYDMERIQNGTANH